MCVSPESSVCSASLLQERSTLGQTWLLLLLQEHLTLGQTGLLLLRCTHNGPAHESLLHRDTNAGVNTPMLVST